MRKKISTIILALFTIAAVAFTGCSQDSGNTSNNSKSQSSQNTQNSSSKRSGSTKVPSKISSKQIKIMVIRKIGGDDNTAQYLAGVKQEGESLGFKVDTFSANGDSVKFHDAISQALQKDYDGFIISHGDDSATVDDVKKIIAKGKPVVTFDSNPEVAKVEGVTITEQDDETLALTSFKKLVQDHNGKANIIYLWVDGFAPMVNRNRMYKAMLEKYPDIKEVERFGVASSDTSVQTQNAVTAMLAKHPKGTIDAIYASWDAFAIGATRAVKEAGRNEIKVYGIDVSNADLQAIQDKNSPWAITTAVDPKLIGDVDVRLLTKKIAGEKTPKYYDLQASSVEKDQIVNSGTAVNMENLSKLIPSWGKSDAFEEPWMDTLKSQHSSK
ncbi:sugar ABC transporter substrate-binding protein [Clostridium coskatii]|uniref:D-ribose transporter subunit RbsB n=1 Tax=Clostridium coskatii TaxID=1705578 RepID=A0A166TL99_9CLOT|nr:sugar ABC transporter substrate-binding protein [Clostridium coskatii]OAA93829.1 D-ribose transporter subunit RbsB [Clostridium coskatii]OBR95157.1 D-ribose transporter subunit RbsB [Clostridium coskatii]